MNHRNSRESMIGARNFPAAMLSQHRRGHSLTLAGAQNRDSVPDDNHLDLFSKNRRSLSVTSSDESSDVSVKLGRLSIGSAKISRNGIDDLLSSDGGKHDYDWLLTPPGTPTIFPSSEGHEPQRTVAAPRGSSLARSSSTTKASRLSVSHSESNHSIRPTRSRSVTRSSTTAASAYNTYSSASKPSSILNTSSASVSSYIRPSSPITRSSSTARPSTPSSRGTLSQPSTPSRARPGPTTSSAEKSRPAQNSRPSTPTSSRPQIPANLSTPTARSNSRPSTPTRRSPVASISPTLSPSISTSRVPSNGRGPAPSSRPSSPSPRVRAPPQPIVPPDFPLDTPPNLRTTMPDRAVSAGRSRPGGSVTPKGHSDPPMAVNQPRRHSSPIVTRGRVSAPEPVSRVRLHGNGHLSDPEPRKGSHAPDLTLRKPVKAVPTNSADGAGFGRTISKKSLDMAIRHMDIRNGGNGRPLSGTTLFPQSIRSVAPKSQSVRGLNYPTINTNGGLQKSYNGLVLENGNGVHRPPENGIESDARHSAKLSGVDIYESSRYDTILLKEDLKNTNWLHSIDDKTDQGPIFDHGFESLPEPFGLL